MTLWLSIFVLMSTVDNIAVLGVIDSPCRIDMHIPYKHSNSLNRLEFSARVDYKNFDPWIYIKLLQI